MATVSFTVTLYNFSKNENSTKRPTGGNSFNCVIKNASGVVSPVMSFNFSNSVNPSSYNYAYIASFGRYYYITEWTYAEGLWHASMTCDVLASYKDEIGASSLYMLRASAESDGKIIDNKYPATYDISVSTTTGSSPWATRLSDGTYIVGVIGNDVNSQGAVSYYTFTQSQFNAFCAMLFESPDWLNMDITEISNELTQVMFNPFQYIVSCIWIPVAGIGIGISGVKFGWWVIETPCGRLGLDATLGRTVTLGVNKHAQASGRGEYLNGSPYAEYELSFFPFGIVPLDSSFFIDASELTVSVIIDYITGKGRMVCTTNSSTMVRRFGTCTAQVGVPIQLAQVAMDYFGAVNSVVGGAGSIAGSVAGGNVLGAITGTVSALGNVLNSANPQVQTSGSNGSIASLEQEGGGGVELRHKFYKIVDEDNAHQGRPLCKTRTPASLGGYMLVSDGDVPINGTLTEASNIKSHLEGGFYYE